MTVDPKTTQDPEVMIHSPFTAQHLSVQTGKLRPSEGGRDLRARICLGPVRIQVMRNRAWPGL